MMILVEVLIQYGSYHVDKSYTYVSDDHTIQTGMRVLVPFNGRDIVGIVLNVIESDLSFEDYQAKQDFVVLSISKVLDDYVILNEELLKLGEVMQRQTISPLINCYSAMLPSKLKPKYNKIQIKMENIIQYNQKPHKFTTLQQDAIDYLNGEDEVLEADFRKKFSADLLSRLKGYGVINTIQREVRYTPEDLETFKPLTLTDDQQAVYDEFLESSDQNYLLHGITGSGKTEIYLQLAEAMIREDKEVLLLVPEISLTPQMIKSVQRRFGDTVAIYHSHLNDQEKYEQYQRVNEKKVKIVVGTRSSIFMPFTNIGLIILDEEHDKSYKQSSSPRYHARDIALWRAEHHGAKVLLASATPALESYARAIKGHYHLLKLPHKIGKNQIIPYKIIDTQKTLYHGGSNIITRPLYEAIVERLEKKQQVVILLNRRGYAPIFTCANCFEVKMCKNCDISMSYHRSDHQLVCHMCGVIEHLPTQCDHCGHKKYNHSGFGTQKVEDELHKLLPQAKIVRMDSDQVSKKGSHERLLNEFELSGDILLGTQMIAKGLDFHRVTLVAVLNADAMLARSSYRASEDTFNLINQVSGRGGRGDLASELIVQSFDAKHYAIVLACENEYIRFFNLEMKYRHLANYPPYSYMIKIIISAKNMEVLEEKTALLYQNLKNLSFDVIGPSDLIKINLFERKQIILRGKNLERMIDEYTQVQNELLSKLHNVNVLVDVNPMEIE